jgi:hypothetical protein
MSTCHGTIGQRFLEEGTVYRELQRYLYTSQPARIFAALLQVTSGYLGITIKEVYPNVIPYSSVTSVANITPQFTFMEISA